MARARVLTFDDVTKTGVLSDLKTYIGQLPEGQFFLCLAHG